MSFPIVYTPEPTRPSGGPQPGTRTLQTWIVNEWDEADAVDDTDPTNLGIYNPRDVCGNPWPDWECKGSQHASGRAGDDGFPVAPGGHPEGHKLAAWLVENHAELGIQEVIWAERRWHNDLPVLPHARWPTYRGRSKHLDHVHWAQNSFGAAGLTIEMIRGVMPMPKPEPEPAPPAGANKEDGMLLIRESGKPEVYLVQGDLMIHVDNGDDRDAIVEARADIDGVATLSTKTFNNFKISHKVIQH